MRLLLDQNISSRVADRLQDLYPGSAHVRGIGLETATDRAVWEHARDNGYLIVSKDSDFRQLSFLHGPPPKVVWIRLGNCTTAEIESLLRAEHARIAEFAADEEAAFLELGAR